MILGASALESPADLIDSMRSAFFAIEILKSPICNSELLIIYFPHLSNEALYLKGGV